MRPCLVAFYCYSANYLIALDHAVIADVEATGAVSPLRTALHTAVPGLRG